MIILLNPSISIYLSTFTGGGKAFSGLIRCKVGRAGLGHRRPGDNILSALHNSSHPTYPHSVTANYDNDHFVDEARLQTLICTLKLEMSLLDSTQGLKRVNSRQNNTELIALTLR